MPDRQLFNKPMNVLREAFVRERFAEPAMFGGSDISVIEGWLQWQRSAEHPDMVAWTSCRELTASAATAPLTHLRERATQHYVQGQEEWPYWRILFLMRGGFYRGRRNVGVFAPGGVEELFVLRGGSGSALEVEYVGDANNHVGVHAVLDVLFAEWECQRPKWREAREFLCDAFAEKIKCERAKAEHDFDTAVAVSADGKSIVHADWVVPLPRHVIPESPSYVSSPGSGRVFPGAVFHDRKVREQALHRITFPSRGLTFDGCLQGSDCLDAVCAAKIVSAVWAAEILPYLPYIRDAQRQFLVVVKPWLNRHGVKQPEAKILLTVEDLCPSPLPDGSIEVTV